MHESAVLPPLIAERGHDIGLHHPAALRRLV
jgi:hypothetical protein